MGDGLPLHLPEQSGHSDGHVSKHKDGECEGIKNLLTGRTIDVFPFGNGGEQAKSIDEHIKIDKQRTNRPDGGWDHLGDGVQAEQGQE